jgi:hypothetical protein
MNFSFSLLLLPAVASTVLVASTQLYLRTEAKEKEALAVTRHFEIQAPGV